MLSTYIDKSTRSKRKFSLNGRKSENKKPLYYDTKVGSIYFGDTVKDKQHIDFDKLLKDMKFDPQNHTISDYVKQNVVPNAYHDREKEIIEILKHRHKRQEESGYSSTANNSQERHIHTFIKNLEDQHKRCQSVMIKRRNWNTSSTKSRHQEENLNLEKVEFGDEYREVLDKLLQPKLPNNRELCSEPSYVYAQKAMKNRIFKKMDILKNPNNLRHLRRGTKTTLIRDMLCILKEKSQRKFSVLEVDTRLGIKA